MTTFAQPWLTEDEVLFHRMESFHRQRVDAIASGQSPLGKRDDGFLAVHLIPRSSVQTRDRIDSARLKEHGTKLSTFSYDGGQANSRFNVDGLMLDSSDVTGSYTQLFRDGRIESVMAEVSFHLHGDADRQKKPDRPRYLRDTTCERGVIRLVKEYLALCTATGIQPPITLFSAVIGCQGVMYYSEWGYRAPNSGIDRSPAFLPEVEITSLDGDPSQVLRPWCDFLMQAVGMEKSPNFDEQGNWRERRR